MEQTLDCFCKGIEFTTYIYVFLCVSTKLNKYIVFTMQTYKKLSIEFTQSHRPEEAIPILTISVNQVLCLRFHERLLEINLRFL